MRSFRILMFAAQFYPAIGGAERQAQKLARALIDRGCRVEVLTPQHDSRLPLVDEIDHVRIHRFPYTDISSRFKKLRGLGVPNTIFGALQVRRALIPMMGQFDLLHGHIASPLVTYAIHAAKALGKQGICKIASSGPDWDLEVMKRTSLVGPLLVKRALASVDMWIAMSEGIRQQLDVSGVHPRRIRCIPNGVIVPGGSMPLRQAVARRFLYMGRLNGTAHRDFATLLRAFDVVAQGIPDCELCLVGGGELESEVRKLLASLPYARRNTRLIGFADPAPWFEWADVVVQPSLAEGMSNTILEAMAAGVCCIANDISANREVLDEGRVGVLVPVGNVDSLAAAMRDMAVTTGVSKLWGERGRQRALAVYSMEKIADQYLILYADLLAPQS